MSGEDVARLLAQETTQNDPPPGARLVHSCHAIWRSGRARMLANTRS